jgi:hypothetical protein
MTRGDNVSLHVEMSKKGGSARVDLAALWRGFRVVRGNARF